MPCLDAVWEDTQEVNQNADDVVLWLTSDLDHFERYS